MAGTRVLLGTPEYHSIAFFVLYDMAAIRKIVASVRVPKTFRRDASAVEQRNGIAGQLRTILVPTPAGHAEPRQDLIALADGLHASVLDHHDLVDAPQQRRAAA